MVSCTRVAVCVLTVLLVCNILRELIKPVGPRISMKLIECQKLLKISLVPKDAISIHNNVHQYNKEYNTT